MPDERRGEAAAPAAGDQDVHDLNILHGMQLTLACGGAGDARGKISCMDQELAIRGLRLPVR